jgi:hypothetical protein
VGTPAAAQGEDRAGAGSKGGTVGTPAAAREKTAPEQGFCR